MHKVLLTIALVGINGLYGNLSGEETTEVFDASTISLTVTQNGREGSGKRYAEKVNIENTVDEVLVFEVETESEELEQFEVAVEPQIVDQEPLELETIEVEPKAIMPMETKEYTPEEEIEHEVDEVDKEVVETEKADEGLTYDQLTQRDGGDSEPEPVPPEVSDSWYDEETAAQGLQLILETYSIESFSFIIDTCPSNYVYQYEFYVDSPEKDHVNLIGIFQYDATGNRTFQLNQISGIWE